VNRERMSLLVLGCYLWVMMILFGSIILETFMVYPNVFHDPPASFATALEFMKIRAPHDFFPPLGFASWGLGAASIASVWSARPARDWLLLSTAMILAEGIVSMAFFWPRNTIMFVEGPAVHSVAVLRQAAEEFQQLHWLRVAFNAVSAAATFAGFLAYYRRILVAQE
jgi:Domain of unknown function (DUF1772)